MPNVWENVHKDEMDVSHLGRKVSMFSCMCVSRETVFSINEVDCIKKVVQLKILRLGSSPSFFTALFNHHRNNQWKKEFECSKFLINNGMFNMPAPEFLSEMK